MIARTLEKEWNDKLGEVERLEREHGEAQRRDRLVIHESDRAQIMELAKDLPRVWNAATTTHAERKNLLRMLIREVSLNPVDVPTKLTKVRVLWQTGVVSELTVERLGRSGWDRSSVEVEQAIAELFAAGLNDEEIAAEVKRRGLLHPRRWHWGAYSVRSLRWRQGLRRAARKPSPEQRPDGPPGAQCPRRWVQAAGGTVCFRRAALRIRHPSRWRESERSNSTPSRIVARRSDFRSAADRPGWRR